MKQIIEIEVPDGKKAVWKDGAIVFEDIKPNLPKTWEEFCKNNPISDKEACIKYNGDINTIQHSRPRDYMLDKNTLPSEQAAKQHLALMQLHQLRDCYRQGWTPIVDRVSFVITRRVEGDLNVDRFMFSPRFLSFQSLEVAQEFLDNFRDLIEQAGDLI